jgi:hypothetical protein
VNKKSPSHIIIPIYHDMIRVMLSKRTAAVGNLVVFTRGEFDSVTGSTNSMKIVRS